ncbi:MAG TPA: glycosyltransferase [Terriglobales bacterium]|nr:glycosyltransferase [Terriglobales bacterium]
MPTVGLSMIVKNGAETLRPCLESVRGIVSQTVIADTGSTDASCDIARDFGASVISIPWENHFANARNAALAPMTTDWVVVLDADEELDRDAKKMLPDLLSVPHVGGYLVPIRNYMPNNFTRGWDRVGVANDHRNERAKDAPSYVVHENCRLFRRDPRVYFAGRLHELVENQILATGLELRVARFCIHHFGQMVDMEARARKHVFYRDLLRTKLEEHPRDHQGWTQLGLHEFECFNNPDEAMRCFEKALTLQPEFPEAWLFKGMVYLNQGRCEEALAAIEHDRRKDVGGALREELKADAMLSLRRFKEARMAYRRAMKLTPENAMLESKLGYTEVHLGQVNSGLAKLRRAARMARDHHVMYDRLLKACIIAGRLPEAAEAAEKLATLVPNPRTFLRAASIRAQLKQWDLAQEILSRGLQRFPDSAELQRAATEAGNYASRHTADGEGRSQDTQLSSV